MPYTKTNSRMRSDRVAWSLVVGSECLYLTDAVYVSRKMLKRPGRRTRFFLKNENTASDDDRWEAGRFEVVL